VPRPKTKSTDWLTLPEVLLPVLQAWWHAKGRPTSGPVFPTRKGNRAGERKRGKISYAKRLREALWQAGIVRPLTGLHEVRAVDGDEAAADAERRARDEHGSPSGTSRGAPRLFVSGGGRIQKPVRR
jgi:integrase